MNVGVFGGTFDPPHMGHLIVAQDAALALGLDRVLFVPAAQPPHKTHRRITPAAVRARMVESALEGDSRFQLEPLELARGGPSFTVDTLRELAGREPGVDWTLLLGADQYEEFDSWREPEEIRRRVRVAVLTRGAAQRGAESADTPVLDVRELSGGAVCVRVTRIDISASAVRARVAAGQPIRYLVPDAVERFIFEQRLYRRNGAAPAV